MATSAMVISRIDSMVASRGLSVGVLFHQALHILDHDDGVVDQHADGKNQAEQGQRVDRIAQREENAERARAARWARRSTG